MLLSQMRWRIGDTRHYIHLRGLVRTLKGQARLFFHVGFANGAADVGHANCKHIPRNLHVRNNLDVRRYIFARFIEYLV